MLLKIVPNQVQISNLSFSLKLVFFGVVCFSLYLSPAFIGLLDQQTTTHFYLHINHQHSRSN
jgi:hypothetical protein